MKHAILSGRRHLPMGLKTSVAVVALIAAAPALAQTAPPPPPPPPSQSAQSTQTLETIEVTGSRIGGGDAASANPITVIGAAQIEQGQSSTVEDVLKKIPAVDFTGGISGGTQNGGNGASNLGLRNLSPERTLILVNGVRFPFTDNQGSVDAVDLNNIPVSMIDSIEVLRDGASSIYGADAIAGVINIKTKQHFQGMELGGQFGETSYGDHQSYDVWSTIGSDFDRGNILINVEESHSDPILGCARAWACTQHPEADYNSFDGVSSRVTGAVISVPGATNTGRWYFPHGLNSGVAEGAAGALGTVPFGDGVYGGGGLTLYDLGIPGCCVLFNIEPVEGITGALERRQINLASHYDITPDITATLEAFYTNRQSSEILNPEPTGYNTPTPQFPNGLFVAANYINGAGLTVPNPYNPTNNAAFDAAAGVAGPENTPILTRRFENGPRLYTDDINTYRIRVGLNGTVLDNYTWELGYSYGQSEAIYRVANEVNFYHMSQELGMNPCGSAVGCSVANFLGFNTLTPAQAAYLIYDNTDNSGYTLSDTYGDISGPVATLPAGDVKAAVGFEYKTDSLFDHPDAVTAAGDGAVFSAPSAGSYATESGYVEVNAPLLKDLPFAKAVTADLSGRYDYNTTFGNAWTHKENIDWAIDDNFRIRSSHAIGYRAPQVKELYGGHFLSAPGGSDPCAAGSYGSSPTNTATCNAEFAAVGYNVAVNGPPQQINQLSQVAGGNPQLKPETSQAWNIGGVYTPTYVPALSVAVDYYTILVRNEIGTFDPNQLLSSCINGTQYVISRAQSCSFIGPRNSLTGSLGNVTALNGNVSDENTDGIDLDINYSLDTQEIGLPNIGKLTLNGQVNYLLSDNNIGLGGFVQQAAGTYNGNNESGEPRWKANLTATLSTEEWSLTASERYYGGIRNGDPSSACEYGNVACPTKGAFDFEGNEAAGVFYTDLSGTYHYKNVTLTVGIENLFDKDPPYLEPTAQVNWISAAGYDAYGRTLYLKAIVNF